MDLFRKINQGKTELIEKSSEDIISEHVNILAKDNDAYRLLRLLIKIMDGNPNLKLLCSFYGLSCFRKQLIGGFYQILSTVDYPFYPGDILIFSHDKEYKKGDTLQYCDLTNEGKLTLHYLIFEYKKEEGVVVRTFLRDDAKKYTVQSWQILGRLVFKYDFGSTDWEKFLESEGVDKGKIVDDIERDIENITESQEFIEKELILSELKRRKEILRSSK